MKSRKKRSIIWTISNEEFAEIIKTSHTIREALGKLNLISKGGNYKTLKARIIHDNLNIDHIRNNSRNHTKVAIAGNITPLDQILIEDSTYTNNTCLKKRLFDAGLLKNQCYECGQLPMWNNKPLILHIDHINGIHADNRIENLRILCPNCHTQTKTYAGKRFKTESSNNQCSDCGKPIGHKSERCSTCNGKSMLKRGHHKHTKIIWPSDQELIDALNTSNYVAVGRKLGVSDNAIRKRLKRKGILHLVH